jgi:hypothetical protein
MVAVVRESTLERHRHPGAPMSSQGSGKSFARIIDMGDDLLLDQDPTVSVSVSFHASVISSVRERVGKRGVSSYVEAAVLRQIERDNLRALIEANEEVHGKITTEELRAAREEIYGPAEGGEGA